MPALHAQRSREPELRLPVLRPQRERTAIALFRVGETAQLEQRGPEVAIALGPPRIEIDDLLIKHQRFPALAELAQHFAEVLQRLDVDGILPELLPVAPHRLR